MYQLRTSKIQFLTNSEEKSRPFGLVYRGLHASDKFNMKKKKKQKKTQEHFKNLAQPPPEIKGTNSWTQTSQSEEKYKTK